MLKNLLKFLGVASFCLIFVTLLSFPNLTKAQSKQKGVKNTFEVRGTVRDSLGLLPGVAVSLKNNPSVGTTTDLNGKFILDVPNENSVIEFSMVGYVTKEISIKGKPILEVTLNTAINTLDEAVVVAYGTQKKESVIGSITTIRPEELKVPSSNLTTALAGRLAGVIAYQRSGEPGADNAQFFIRGATTFGYKKDPLILIDGMEYSTTDLARLQPDDIASFSIMKDATANALYGARGANGVILVTTKQGVEGKAKINVRFENSTSGATKDVALADPITYMKLQNESVLTRNPLGILPYSQAKIANTASGINPVVFPAINWKDQLFKKQTNNQRLNFNLGGGGKIATYYLSGGVNQDNGIMKVDHRNNFNNNIDFKTYNLRSNVNINITKSTKALVRLYGTFDDYNGPIDGGTGMYNKVMRSSQVLFPAYYTPDSTHAYVNHILFGNYDQGGYLNPYADMVKGYKQSSRSLMLAQFELNQDLSSMVTKGLSIRGMMNTNREAFFSVSRSYNPFYYTAGGYDKLNNTYQIYEINPDQGTDYLGFNPGDKTVVSTFYGELAANYNRDFGKNGITGMLVLTARNQLVGNASDLQKSLPARNMGLSGRLTYAYDNRYFGEVNFGYNGSERFYKSKRFGFFPSAGAAWYISNEKFFEPFRKIINKLKIRGNYGLVGNDAIGSADDRFFYLSNVNMNNGSYGATFGTNGGYHRDGISIDRYPNQDITWETAKNSTFGLEMGLFGQLDIIAEYFTEHRYNILMDRASIPSTMGLQGNKPKANVGKSSSKSVDISLNYNKNFNKDFFLSVLGNFTFARNKFVAYEEPAYDEPYLYRVGHPINQQWGYIAERLFVDEEEVRSSPTQNFGNFQTMAGDIKYRDVNGDGVINNLDMVPIGFPTSPEIVYGFGFSSKFKNFDLSAFLQGSARSSFWIDVAATSPFIDNDNNSSVISQNQLLSAYANSHWSEDNRNLYAMWPRLSSTLNENSTQRSTWFMRNGSFLRLKQVELGYTIKNKMTQKMGVSNLRLYISGTNLATISGFKLWDVEMGGNGLGYPIQKVYNLGVQVGF